MSQMVSLNDTRYLNVTVINSSSSKKPLPFGATLSKCVLATVSNIEKTIFISVFGVDLAHR